MNFITESNIKNATQALDDYLAGDKWFEKAPLQAARLAQHLAVILNEYNILDQDFESEAGESTRYAQLAVKQYDMLYAIREQLYKEVSPLDHLREIDAIVNSKGEA